MNVSFRADVSVSGNRFAKIAKALKDEWEATSQQVADLQRQTVETWEHKPTFIIDRVSGRDLIANIGPTDDSGEIWWYLNSGTRVRYASMTSDWVSKTQPRRIRPGQGRGQVAYISRRRPRPGITAREWAALIAEQVQPQYSRRLRAIRTR